MLTITAAIILFFRARSWCWWAWRANFRDFDSYLGTANLRELLNHYFRDAGYLW